MQKNQENPFAREKRTMQQSVDSMIAARQRLNKGNRLSLSERNSILAENIRREDLGEFDEQPPCADAVYKFILANARQDAAHAVLNSNDTIDILLSLRRLVWVVLIFLICIAVQLFQLR